MKNGIYLHIYIFLGKRNSRFPKKFRNPQKGKEPVIFKLSDKEGKKNKLVRR